MDTGSWRCTTPFGYTATGVSDRNWLIINQIEISGTGCAMRSEPEAQLGRAVAGLSHAFNSQEAEQFFWIAVGKKPQRFPVERFVDHAHCRFAHRVAEAAGSQNYHAQGFGQCPDRVGEQSPEFKAPAGSATRWASLQWV